MQDFYTVQENQRKINNSVQDEKPASYKAGSGYRYLIIFFAGERVGSSQNWTEWGRVVEDDSLHVCHDRTWAAREANSQNR